MTSEDTQAAANMGIKLPEPYCRTGDSMAPTLQPLFSAEQMQAMFEVGRSRAASEPGEVAPAPDLSSDTVVELQMLEEHLERWARGECLSAPKNGYDDPGHRTASMRDVTKTLAFLLPRFKNARAALLKFAVEYEQFKSGTYSPEDEGAGWPFPSSSAPQPASSPVAAEGQKAEVLCEQGEASSTELLSIAIPNDYTILFNAIADATRLEWGGTAIGISVTQFRKSIAAATPTASMADAAEAAKCACGDRLASECDEQWGPNCDLGNNAAHVRVSTVDPAVIDAALAAPSQDGGASAATLARWRQWLLGYEWQPKWSTASVCLAIADEILATPGHRGENAGGVVEAQAVIAELVALKDLKDATECWVRDVTTGAQWPKMPYEERMAACAEYNRRKPLAWAAARACATAWGLRIAEKGDAS